MKASVKLLLMNLTVLSCVRCDEISVSGSEGGSAVINCPYQKGYEPTPKYLWKGKYGNGVDVIRSNGGSEWTHRGKVYLQDRKESNIFTVTIHNLNQEDAGTYGCGVDNWGPDFYTIVKLSIVKESKPQPAVITTANPGVTMATPVTTSGTDSNATVSLPSATTESDNATYSHSDQPSATSGLFAYLSGGMAAALVLFGLLTVIFRLMKSRSKRKGASPSADSGATRPGSVCVYAEIELTPLDVSDQQSSSPQTIYSLTMPPAANHLPQPTPASTQAANHRPQPTPAGDDVYSLAIATPQAANHLPQPTPAGDDVYSLATNPTPALHSGASSATNQQSGSDSAIYCNLDLANENPDCYDYAAVVFSDEPIRSDSASVRVV